MSKNPEKSIIIETYDVRKGLGSLPSKQFLGSHSDAIDYLRRQSLKPMKSLNEKGFDGIHVSVITGQVYVTQLPNKEPLRRGSVSHTLNAKKWIVHRFIRNQKLQDIAFKGTLIDARVFLENWINQVDPDHRQYIEHEKYTIEVTIFRDAVHCPPANAKWGKK